MNYGRLAILSTVGILALAAACSSAPSSVRTTTESTTRTAGGSVETTSETKEVGATLVGKSETKADPRDGTSGSKTDGRRNRHRLDCGQAYRGHDGP